MGGAWGSGEGARHALHALHHLQPLQPLLQPVCLSACLPVCWPRLDWAVSCLCVAKLACVSAVAASVQRCSSGAGHLIYANRWTLHHEGQVSATCQMGPQIRMPRLVVVGRSAVFSTVRQLPQYWWPSPAPGASESEELLLPPRLNMTLPQGSADEKHDSEKGHDASVYESSLSNVSLDTVVDFDGIDDPTDPLNWSSAYKWSLVTLISFLSLIV